MAGLIFPKPRPRKLEKADRLKARVSIDERESAKVRKRSGGWCEVVTVGHAVLRCPRRAVHVHHQLGGIGVRGRGKSALAENKADVCSKCHSDIHAHVLVLVRGRLYRRVT